MLLTLRCGKRALFMNERITCVDSLTKNIATIKADFLSSWQVATSEVSLIDKMKVNDNSSELLAPSNSFKFGDYDCLGFDLDNTICRYKVSNMVKLEYKCISEYLINNKKYSAKYLQRPIEDNVDFMIKGLILDVKKGNVLRISPNGYILHGTHGTRELTRDEITGYYGPEGTWTLTNMFIQNPLDTWNGPLSENMRTLLDYFDMPASLAFARAVDTIDEQNGGELSEYNIYPHIVEALQDMFQREHFELSKGGYFPNIKSDPENYIHKCSQELKDWFITLKKNKKILFLITGSNIDFASHTASHSMGDEWRSLFHIVICFAKKPGFFTAKRPFKKLDGMIEGDEIAIEDLQVGNAYTHGNWEGLHTFLKLLSNKKEPKIVYVGDNLIQDIYTPAVHTECDTVAVCEELEAEGVFGHESVHNDKHFLVSSVWGSYFHQTNQSTIWKEIINKHAKLCIPSLEYVAQFPINHNFCFNNN